MVMSAAIHLFNFPPCGTVNIAELVFVGGIEAISPPNALIE
jgi:hypothetical protein